MLALAYLSAIFRRAHTFKVYGMCMTSYIVALFINVDLVLRMLVEELDRRQRGSNAWQGTLTQRALRPDTPDPTIATLMLQLRQLLLLLLLLLKRRKDERGLSMINNEMTGMTSCASMDVPYQMLITPRDKKKSLKVVLLVYNSSKTMSITFTPTQLESLKATLLNTAGTTPLHERFRALFTLKAAGGQDVVEIIAAGTSI